MKIDESLRRSVRLLLFLVMAVQVHYSSWITPDPLSPLASSCFLPGRFQGFETSRWTTLGHPVGRMLCQRVQWPLLDQGG